MFFYENFVNRSVGDPESGSGPYRSDLAIWDRLQTVFHVRSDPDFLGGSGHLGPLRTVLRIRTLLVGSGLGRLGPDSDPGLN
jgi:hypothetical protein